MRAKRASRYTSRLGAAMSVALVPLVLTSSGDLAAVSRSGPGAGDGAVVSSLDGIEYSMASRSAARAAVVEQVDPEALTDDPSGRAQVSAKGTRLWTPSAMSDHGIPVAAERAYRHAAALMDRTDPGCQLPWTLLAGIGMVESDHGQYDGARLSTDGVSRPEIIGLPLNGVGPVAAIADTDDGRLDHDKVWDRAVGPLQFIPSTWRTAARDGDGDGRMSPHDIDDAAAAAASYLCSGSGSLRDPATQAAAIYRYNQDDYYVALVQAFEVGYRTGSFVMPPPPVDEDQARKARLRKRREAAAERERQQRIEARAERRRKAAAAAATDSPQPAPSPKPSPSPSPAPAPKPSPSPSPSPSPTTSDSPRDLEGAFTQCDGGYCLAGKLLDLGVVAQLDEKAKGDFDEDGQTETNGDEVSGMLGTTVTMKVVTLDDGRLGIYTINGVSLA